MTLVTSLAAGISNPALRTKLALFVSMVTLPQLLVVAIACGLFALVLRQRESRTGLMMLCAFLSAAFFFAAGTHFFAGLFLETNHPTRSAKTPRTGP
jgi:hypothetical protein